MSNFYKMAGNVGVGQANKRPDVAYLQLVVKNLGGLIRPRGQSQYIDGVFHKTLMTSLLDFWQPDGKKWQGVVSAKGDLTVKPAGGIQLAKLLPPEFRKYRLYIGGSQNVFLAVHDPSGGSGAKPLRFRSRDIALPSPYKKNLLNFFQSVTNQTHFIPKIERINVDNGFFYVHVSWKGGRLIDQNTGRIRESMYLSTSPFSKTEAAAIVEAMVIKNKDKVCPGWTRDYKPQMVFRTNESFPALKILLEDKRRILKQLGFPGSAKGVDKEAIETCYVAYELARNKRDLTKAEKDKFFECFGADRDIILRNEQIRIAACLRWMTRFENLAQKQKGLIRDLAQAQQELNHVLELHGDFEDYGLPELLTSVAFDLISLGKGKFLKHGLKHEVPGVSQRALETADFIGSQQVSTTVLAISDDNTTFDYFIYTVSFAAGIAAIAAAGTAFATVAGIFGLAATFVSIGESIYDFFATDDKLDEAVDGASKAVTVIFDLFAENTQQIAALWSAMEIEGCFKNSADFFGLDGLAAKDMSELFPGR